MDKDTIYSLPLQKVGDFRFDEQVVRVFPDMIQRSVPGYGSILSMIGELAERYAVPKSNIYDLGCSLGACTLMMRERAPQDCVIHSVDTSEAMIEGLKGKLVAPSDLCEVRLNLADIREIPMLETSLSVLNFTLQFVPQAQREALLRKVAEATLDGGALVLSEKISFPNSDQQDLLTELHHSFKKANGYSELEIAQKRAALEKTLIPETIETHLNRLTEVGFRQAFCWFQCFNFVSILAVK
jgi:tRNA (cmo5U34)-methyltransferase